LVQSAHAVPFLFKVVHSMCSQWDTLAEIRNHKTLLTSTGYHLVQAVLLKVFTIGSYLVGLT